MRFVIHFHWRKNFTISETSRGVDDIYGQGAPCLRTGHKLVARFAAGGEGLEDRARSGRARSDHNISLIAQLFVDHLDFSQKVIAGILSIHEATITRTLLEVRSLRKINFK
jgi:hypothetical protein